MSQAIQDMVRSKAQVAKAAKRTLSKTSVDGRNKTLLAMADSILTFKDKIQEANHIDLEEGRKTGLAEPLMQRLELDDKRLTGWQII